MREPSPKPTTPIILYLLVIGAFATQGVVLYFGSPPFQRLGLGLLILAMIVWAAIRLEKVERAVRAMRQRRYRRQYYHLRFLVDQLISEVRRLHGMAFDGKRGFRDNAQASVEMDAIEARMHDLVKTIRQEAERLRTEAPEEAGTAEEASTAAE